jgi:hypothetical protein
MRARVSLVVALLVCILLVAVASAQGISEIRVHAVDPSQFPINFVYCSVTDADGGYLGWLPVEELSVLENGTEERLWPDEEAERFPASLVLVIDSSGSMKGAMSDVLSAASSLVGMLDEGDTAEVIDFDSTVRVVQGFTGETAALSAAVQAISADGGTALYDAVKRGVADAETREGLKAVVLLTDGKDENAGGDGPGSTATWDELKSVMGSSGVAIHAIGLGSGVDRATLQAIADLSGGRAYFAEDADAVGAIYGDIMEYLHSLRRFHYVTRDGRPDGTRREVVLRAHEGDAQSQTFYHAPMEEYWTYAFWPLDETYIHHLAMPPDGGYIAALNVASVLLKDGTRVYIHWDGRDAFGGVCSNQYVCDRGWQDLGSLSRFDGRELTPVELGDLLGRAGGSYHREWGWNPKAISKGGTHIVLASKQDDQEYRYYFAVYDMQANKVVWEEPFYRGDFDEPGAAAVADNGTALITQDYNLFAVARDGSVLYEWMWEQTGNRFAALAMAGDGSRFVARLDDDLVRVYNIDGGIAWHVESKTEDCGGGIDMSSSGAYVAVNDLYGPRVFDARGQVLFQDVTEEPAPGYQSENGIAIADDGSFVFARGNRICYRMVH